MRDNKRLSFNELLIKFFLNMDEEETKDKVDKWLNVKYKITYDPMVIRIDTSHLPELWRPEFEEYERHQDFANKRIKFMPTSYQIYRNWIDIYDAPIFYSKFHNSELIMLIKGIL